MTMESGLYGQEERGDLWKKVAEQNRFDDVECEGEVDGVGRPTERAYRRMFGLIAREEILAGRHEEKFLRYMDDTTGAHRRTNHIVREMLWQAIGATIEQQQECHRKMAELWDRMFTDGYHVTICNNALTAAFPIAYAIMRAERAKQEAASRPKCHLKSKPRSYNADIAAALYGTPERPSVGEKAARIARLKEQILAQKKAATE